MATFTSNIPVPTIDAAGFHMPAFADILAGIQADYTGNYGSDVYIQNDSQDGQWLGIQAQGYSDVYAVALAVYNSFSPATAQGTGLSSVVKVNGITRDVSSYSTVAVTIIGVANTVLTNCVVSDGTYKWSLPATVTIPLSGTVTVTATCQTLGSIAAPVGTVNQISTPTRGWQSANNLSPGSLGAPVETDPQLRIRQGQSTALPAQSIMDGLLGAILEIPNVARLRGYMNTGNTNDANGLPGNSISLVIDGGDSQTICNTILLKKSPGVGTYGTATSPLPSYDAYGIPRLIYYFRPAEPAITYLVTVKAFAGFTIDYQNQIAQAVSDWTNALGIGCGLSGVIRLTRVYGPALLSGTAAANTFEILSIAIARDGAVPGSADITIAFNEAPACQPSFVSFAVST